MLSSKTSLISFAARMGSLSWLTGPIFDKEMRVSSRRRRNYVLRFFYMALLTGFVILVWRHFAQVFGRESQASRVSQMSEAGKFIITYVIWFQFCVTQFLAVVMLSNSISDEIYHMTLGVLMTTPINSLQIVVGKLFSKLLQLVLFLVISLPLLAVVRVFGGVPAHFIFTSLAVTFTAVVFAGACSLFLSIYSRRSYEVIIKALFVLGIFYAFSPFLTACLVHQYVPVNKFFWALSHINPFVVMYYYTQQMLSAGTVPWLSSVSWSTHCGLMLLGSALLVLLSSRVVRRVALSQACGVTRGLNAKSKRRQKTNNSNKENPEETPGTFKRIQGSAIVWKEFRSPLLRGGRQNYFLGIVFGIIAMLITYGICAYQKTLSDIYTHAWYAAVFTVLGSVCATILAATCITYEKESRCWPILLATTLDDWSILWGKILSVIKRCLPIWLLLMGHMFIFIMAGYIHPIVLVHLALMILWLMIFLSATGVYFSACFQRTATSVIASFALAAVLWAVAPMVLGLTGRYQSRNIPLATSMKANPMVQVEVMMNAVGGASAELRPSLLVYRWPFFENSLVGEFTLILLKSLLFYTTCAVLFAWRAKARFRRNIF